MTIAEMFRMEGREQGIEKAKYEMTKNLLSMTGDLHFIAKATSLSLEEIEQIKEIA